VPDVVGCVDNPTKWTGAAEDGPVRDPSPKEAEVTRSSQTSASERSEQFDTSEPYRVDAKGARLREAILAGRHREPLLCELGTADLLDAHYHGLGGEYTGDVGTVWATINVRTRRGPTKWATSEHRAPMVIQRSPTTGRIARVIIGDPAVPDRCVQARQIGPAMSLWVESEMRAAIDEAVSA
jgi:hypothetical protein